MCNFCQRVFAWKTRLNDHVRTHSEEKPYICLVCQKAFTSKTYLNGHAKTHTGLKPHQCRLCPKRFASKPGLSYHAKTHNGETTFRCSFCDRNSLEPDDDGNQEYGGHSAFNADVGHFIRDLSLWNRCQNLMFEIKVLFMEYCDYKINAIMLYKKQISSIS